MIVEPIKDIKKIEKIKKLLEEDKKIKELCLFIIGINSALRVSDILNLKWSDVLEENEEFKGGISIIEKKTRKKRKFKLNENFIKALKILMKNRKNRNMNEYLFQSESNRVKGMSRAWTRQYVHEFLSLYARRAGVEANVSSHSMRKTFSYHAYKSGVVDISMLQKILNHSSQAVTLRYIGIEQEDIDNVYMNVVNL